MRKLLPIIFILLVAGQAWCATYVVTDEAELNAAFSGNDLSAGGHIIDIQSNIALAAYIDVTSADSGVDGSPNVITSTNGSTITCPDGASCFYFRSDYVKFSNLDIIAHANGSHAGIDIATAANTFTGLEVNGCTFTNLTRGGVNWLVNNTNASILESPSITDSTFVNCGHTDGYGAIGMRSESTAVNAVLTSPTVTGNAFLNSPYIDIYIFGQGTAAAYGWSGGVVIQNNSGTNPGDGCIKLSGFAAADWGTNLISGNYCTGSQGVTGGINVFWLQYFSIYGNKVEDGTTTSIDGNGILIDAGNQYGRVYSNEINRMLGKTGVINSGTGIMVLDSQNISLYKNFGIGNKAGLHQGDTGNISISFVSFSNNSFIENVDFGIVISSDIDATDLAEVVFRNNIMTGDGSGTDISDNSTGGGTVDENYNDFYNFSTEVAAGASTLNVDPQLTADYSSPVEAVYSGGTDVGLTTDFYGRTQPSPWIGAVGRFRSAYGITLQ